MSREKRKDHKKCSSQKKHHDKDRDEKWREECEKEEVEYQKVHKQDVHRQNVDRQNVENSTVTNLTVVGLDGGGGSLDVDQINTRRLFINNKEFPTSIIPFKISESMVIVGTNGGGCIGDCPDATPGTPEGGLFALGKSFTGKITFCGVSGLNLNLVGLVLSNVDDYAIEIINCNQVYIYGGSVNSVGSPAIHVACSTDVTFANVNTVNSDAALFVENSLDIKIRNWYMQNLVDFAIRVESSRYLRFTGLDINNISSFASESLILCSNSDMIFVNNCAFYNIDVQDAVARKSIILMDVCFDVKISHISVLATSFTAPEGENLEVSLVHFTKSGSLVLGSFIVDGDNIAVSGTGTGRLNCLKLDECNNVFMAHHLMTDNFVEGDSDSTSLIFVGVSLRNVETFTMNGSKICTNYVRGGSPTASIVVFSFSGAEDFSGGLRSGNWFLSGNICNQNYVTDNALSLVGGFNVSNVSSTVLFQNCSSNNHGNSQNTARRVIGFQVTGNLENNSVTNINFNHCAANQNNSNDVTGRTFGFLSTYSNTMITNSEAIGGRSGLECVGFLLPGIVGQKQFNVALFNCTGSTNVSENAPAFGVLAGATNIVGANTAGVETIAIKKCTFTANIGFSGYGIALLGVTVSSIIGNLLNQNNLGLFIDGGSANSVIANSAINNDRGFRVVNSPDSIFEKNLAQTNDVGFFDNTPGGNTYYTNKAVSNSTQFDMVGFVIPVYNYDKETGIFTFVSGNPGLTAFTNLSS